MTNIETILHYLVHATMNKRKMKLTKSLNRQYRLDKHPDTSNNFVAVLTTTEHCNGWFSKDECTD